VEIRGGARSGVHVVRLDLPGMIFRFAVRLLPCWQTTFAHASRCRRSRWYTTCQILHSYTEPRIRRAGLGRSLDDLHGGDAAADEAARPVDVRVVCAGCCLLSFALIRPPSVKLRHVISGGFPAVGGPYLKTVFPDFFACELVQVSDSHGFSPIAFWNAAIA